MDMSPRRFSSFTVEVHIIVCYNLQGAVASIPVTDRIQSFPILDSGHGEAEKAAPKITWRYNPYNSVRWYASFMENNF